MTEAETITTRAAWRRDASIENISWDLLRLIFLREGKIAGRAWPASAEDAPAAVREHLVNVLSILSSSLSGLDEELRDSLMSVYFASAKKIRSEDDQHEQQAADLTYEAVRERIRTEVGRHGGDAHWELSEDVCLVGEQIASEPWSPIPQDQITAIYREIGRICGPLLLTMGLDGFPDLPDTATNALRPVIEARVEIAPVFNELTHELELPELGIVASEWANELVATLRASSQRYYYGRDPLAPLPTLAEDRAVEIERRANRRAELNEKAESAVDRIVRPILTSYKDHLERLVAAEMDAAAERDREDVARRAAAGFDRPEPQRYGVSPRGAELWVTDALRWIGLHDAETTQQTADGGVDVIADGFAVSVKNYAGAVPVEEVREIFGVGVAVGRVPLLWTSGTLTASAQQFADVAPVGVVQYDVATATWTPLNDAAAEFLARF